MSAQRCEIIIISQRIIANLSSIIHLKTCLKPEDLDALLLTLKDFDHALQKVLANALTSDCKV